MKNLKIYTDGGARGNPGPAAYGVVINTDQGETLYEKGQAIGRATNNEAEYQGLIAALKWLSQVDLKVSNYIFYLDSRLVVKQMQGKFKVKANNLKPLWQQAQQLAKKLSGQIKYQHIPREKNAAPDELLNQALDASQTNN
jgi:ribonuclease HI